MPIFSRKSTKSPEATTSVAEARQALGAPAEVADSTPPKKAATEVVLSHARLIFEDHFTPLAAAAILAAPELPVIIEHARDGACCAEPWDLPPQPAMYQRETTSTRLIAALNAAEPGSGAKLRVQHRPEAYRGYTW